MTPIHEKPFQPQSAAYVRKLYRSGISVDDIAYRLDCYREQILREVAGMKQPPQKSSSVAVHRKKAIRKRLAKLGLS